jgi:hypothetical protein
MKDGQLPLELDLRSASACLRSGRIGANLARHGAGRSSAFVNGANR